MCHPLLSMACYILDHLQYMSDLHIYNTCLTFKEVRCSPWYCALPINICKTLCVNIIWFFPYKIYILMYEHLSLHGVSPEKLSSSIWPQYFVDQEHWRQPIRIQHSQRNTGIQLMHNMTQIHHPAVHTWSVWRTFQMTNAFFWDIMQFSRTSRWKLQIRTSEMPLIIYFGAIMTLGPTMSELPTTSKTVLHLDNDMKQMHQACLNLLNTCQWLAIIMSLYKNLFPQQTVCLCIYQEIKTNKHGKGSM